MGEHILPDLFLPAQRIVTGMSPARVGTSDERGHVRPHYRFEEGAWRRYDVLQPEPPASQWFAQDNFPVTKATL